MKIPSFSLCAVLTVTLIASAVAADAPPAYEWNMTDLLKTEGCFVPNSGTRGAAAVSVPQLLAAPGVVLDEDGVYTHRRIVADPEVADPLGHHEAVTLEFTEASQKQGIINYRDHPDLPAADATLSVWVKRKGETPGRFVLGPLSKNAGEIREFDAPEEWTEVSLSVKLGGDGSDVSLRPTAGGSLPAGLSVYAPMLWKGEKIPLDQYRTARQSGQAVAPLALPGAMNAEAGGGTVPGGRVPNLQAELAPEKVTSFALSGWIKVDKLPAVRGYFAGFSRSGDPTDRTEERGSLGIMGEKTAEDFKGRLMYAPGGNLDRQLYSPHFDGSGWLHVHINYGHPGSDMPFGGGKVAHELLVNGIPFHERATEAIGEFVPRLLSLGGLDGSAKSIQKNEGAWHNAFELVRYEPNTRVPRDEVFARVRRDREKFPNLREPLDALIVVEGDSTSAFRGSPIFMFSRELRQPGRLFVNHSRGGSWYQGGKESNSDYIGTGQRRAMRRDALAKGLELGYRKAFTLWTPGENDGNGRGVLRPEADPSEAVKIFTDFILDDLEAVDPGRKRTRSIFVSMKMSDFRDVVKDKVRAYWAALDAIYTEPVDPVNAPYLYRAPAGTPGRTHDYFIAMHKWIPTNGKHTWKDWAELAADAKADRNGAREIISGDGQHWTQGWNDHVAKAIHIPSLKKIFEIEGVNEVGEAAKTR